MEKTRLLQKLPSLLGPFALRIRPPRQHLALAKILKRFGPCCRGRTRAKIATIRAPGNSASIPHLQCRGWTTTGL